MSIYSSAPYVASWSSFGRPVLLPRSGAGFLLRDVPGTSWHDLLGVHPRVQVGDVASLQADLASPPDGVEPVTAVWVFDAFTDPEQVEACFGTASVCRPFKTHHLVDLSGPIEEAVGRHHRYYGRKASRDLDIQVLTGDEARAFASEFWSMYEVLTERHGLRGMAAMSAEVVAAQLALPGAVLVVARADDRPVGATIWLVDGERIYNHLHAMHPDGYRTRAAYGLYWQALHHARERGVVVADLGAGAGADDDPEDGLAVYKAGWATHQRQAWLVGVVLREDVNDELSGGVDTTWFPAYRGGAG